MARSGPMMMRLLIRSHDVPRDSFSSCLKFRTSFRRLTTLEMGKKHKQNLEHSVSNLLAYFLRLDYTIVQLFPSKRIETISILRFRQTCQQYASMRRSMQSPIGVSMGSRCLLPRRIVPKLILLNSGTTHNQVL